MQPRSGPYIIGIAGGSGSGKTSVTERILHELGNDRVLLLQHDSYYKDLSVYGPASPDQINFDHPDALETDLLVRHLEALRDGQAVDVPRYDFTTHRRTGSTRVHPHDIVLLDGILIFSDESLRRQLDLKIFVDTEADERLLRRIRRDMTERGRSLDSVVHQYHSTVKPMHLQFVEPSKHWADIIIPRGAENIAAIDLIVGKIREVLSAG